MKVTHPRGCFNTCLVTPSIVYLAVKIDVILETQSQNSEKILTRSHYVIRFSIPSF